MAIEAARLSPSLTAAFLGPPLRRALPLQLPRLRLRRRLSLAAAAGGDDGPRAVALPSSELRKRRGASSSSSSAAAGSGGDERLRSLRGLFARPDIAIDAYIVPSQDAHQSEFIAECFMRRAYLTGFTGSAGTAVVTKDKAALWTDGRYFLQAEKELSHDWTLMRSGNHGVPTTSEWLKEVLPSGCRVGIDPFLFSFDAAEELKDAIFEKNHELVLIRELNLVDEIWGEARPEPPKQKTRVHGIKYAGIDVPSKLSSVRSQLADDGCDAVVISLLDEVAWLLNMRGSDVPNSPVFYSYLIVEDKTATLFVDNNKVSEDVLEHLEKAGVKLKPYEAILSDVERLAQSGKKLWLDSSSINAAIVNVFRASCDRHVNKRGKAGRQSGKESPSGEPGSGSSGVQNGNLQALYKVSPVTLAKAVKNEAEIEGMKSSHIRDAAALAEFWCWLEGEVRESVLHTEVQVSEKLLEFRQKQDGFIDTSFDTISGYGANGAIIHYRPTPESCSSVGSDNLFLLDSGAQYIDGTTDITRTVHFGEPSPRQKECFTKVLQGHIALDQAVFPERTPGFVLDVLARSSLWKIGLDYRHGTGHGVGAALNVHEGPQSISYRYGNLTALQKGMIVSNEPGYYEDNSFGIRIENLLLVKEVNLPNSFGGVSYLGFEKLTFVPIQSKLIDLSLLSPSEINWINEYHEEVWEKVSPLLSGDSLDWLRKNTRPL
ncbi:aminopeptidase P2 [Oryza brachyantha]|uniref:aminopeptidase P2 n=1 Tax=Oryza brachyantha TaxID=4533 RepID=UPI001ADA066F|nr:aminopeptidase P2 [Oryza brachyantha]